MRPTPTILAFAAANAVLFGFIRRTSALGPIDVEVAARAGYATNPTPLPSNPLGFGVGARGGVSFFNVYVGASGMYYFGTFGGTFSTGDDSFFQSYGVLRGGTSLTSALYGGELGYNVEVPFVTIRPQVGLGNYVINANNLSFGPSSRHSLYLEPGVLGEVKLGIWRLGIDANVLVLPSMAGSQAAFTLHGQFGIQF